MDLFFDLHIQPVIGHYNNNKLHFNDPLCLPLAINKGSNNH